jgi:short subunit dehydrogenase-like uncharacterized protein
MSTRDFDVVLYGATSFAGRVVADYLAAGPAAGGLRWALAGRDRGKLERVRGALAAAHPALAELPVLVADAGDAEALEALARRTRVVCSTVGPYARYGSELVAACVRARSHYCDITGEVHWIRRMIDAHHEQARADGTRLVPCCGFDSVPSDLGVAMVHREALARGLRLRAVDAFFGESRGKLGGGTIATMFATLDEARRDRETRRLLADPYALDPRPRQGGPDRSDLGGLGYERRLGRWTAPWVMASINARVVRRSNALAGYPYGADFRYREVMSLPGGVRGLLAATAVTAGLAGLSAGSQLGPVRRLLEKRLPAPGEGPPAEERARGHWLVRMLATAEPADGGAPVELQARIADQRDPGFDSTAAMLAESALCLARDPLASPGGVLTPATAMGDALLARLRAAGLTFEMRS